MLCSTHSLNRFAITLIAFLVVGLPHAAYPDAAVSTNRAIHGFFLHSKDTVVFLGDSITALNAGTWPAGTTRPNYTYCADIVSWAVTHRPKDRITFYDLGVPGDTAQGDVWPSGGPSSVGVPPNQSIDQHLQYVKSLNPTVVTINLGMNDGEYVDCDPADNGYDEALYRSFTSGLTHIVTTLLAWSVANEKPLRIVVLSPSYYDNACRVATGWKFGWGPPVANYNQTLRAFGKWEKTYIAQLGNPNVTFVDLNAPMLAATKKLPPGESLTQEGIHPTEQGYEVIAATILDAWNAGAEEKTSYPRSAPEASAELTVPWALYNGGTAYDICPLLARVNANQNQGMVAWENNLIRNIRDQFVQQETSVVRNFTIPSWDPQRIYQALAHGTAQPPAR